MKNIALAYIYQLAKSGELISRSLKNILKNAPSHVLILIMTA